VSHLPAPVPADRFTVFGARGFIGTHLVRSLREYGAEVLTPERASPISGENMGHVIYAVGLTANFRSRPYETMTAHVSHLTEILERARHKSFLYLSSTRVYGRAAKGDEDITIPVDIHDPGDLYNISKLAGESLCVSHRDETVRVARLSNVFGPAMVFARHASSTFLASIVQDAVCNRHVELGTSPGSSKDFVDVEDVASALGLIALHGTERLYNVASGQNVTHATLLNEIARLTGCTWSTSKSVPHSSFPAISTDLVSELFETAGKEWAPADVIDALPTLIQKAQSHIAKAEGAVA